MNSNFKVDKSYLNFIHARSFFLDGEAEEARQWLSANKFELMENGYEIKNFNLVFPNIEMVVGGMLGEWVKIDDKDSGTFRIPFDNQVMFEAFTTINEWRMAVALENTTFKTYTHISGAKDAKDDINFDYLKLEDWFIETTINLKQNDAIFYRPWLFHSFEAKMIHHHKIYVQEN